MMKLSMSNIAWAQEEDTQMYETLQQMGFSGLEIAPTRIFPQDPYKQCEQASAFAQSLRETYQLAIPSMQSIWFGQSGKMFESRADRETLLSYTKEAIIFAEAMQCKNLVFGCPRNRSMPEGITKQEERKYIDIALAFFDSLADFAMDHGTVIAMEANPPIYHTNFVNETMQAYELVKEINKKGFQINLDLGTMIQNDENPKQIQLDKMVPYINHVHISEPGLALIQKRDIHSKVRDMLQDGGYEKFISIEMGKQDSMEQRMRCMAYVVDIFS